MSSRIQVPLLSTVMHCDQIPIEITKCEGFAKWTVRQFRRDRNSPLFQCRAERSRVIRTKPDDDALAGVWWPILVITFPNCKPARLRRKRESIRPFFRRLL